MRLAVLGERVRVAGYALAGAIVYPADDPDEVRAAWLELPADVAVLVLTPAAARALGGESAARRRPGLLTAVMPP
jgi:vacuolar-type H+-ATPase subunit F/Vma7